MFKFFLKRGKTTKITTKRGKKQRKSPRENSNLTRANSKEFSSRKISFYPHLVNLFYISLQIKLCWLDANCLDFFFALLL